MRITCLVDNCVRRSSPFWGEHGLAMLIDTGDGCVLFDTGASGTVLLHNQRLLGEAWPEPQAVVLSHAHNDHSGGLRAFLAQRPGRKLLAHPDIFVERFSVRGIVHKAIGLPLTAGEMTGMADVRLSATPVEIVPKVWTTGEITGRLEPEGRSPLHMIAAGSEWKPDPYVDDMSLVLELRSGLALICGCCHAGLLNTLRQVRTTFGRPVVLIAGGTHLVEADDEHLNAVGRVLVDCYGSPRLYLNHCTGEPALVRLAQQLGDRVQALPAGATLTLE